MKILIKGLFNKAIITLFIICIFSCSLTAQNQSMLLPIPGDTYPVSSGSKVINFSNITNPVISTLPHFSFHVPILNNITGNPHDEYHLQNSDEDMNEKYLGQHPMYAQSVVHDKDGNLLFFIVDNNIYNRYGEA